MYSAANLPSDPELTFHIQIHREGRAPQHFTNILKFGDMVRLRGPLGAAYLRQPYSAPTPFASSGTSLGPMLAQLRAFANAGNKNSVHIIFWIRDV